MARQWRLEYEGAVYHVMACGRQVTDHADTARRRFLDFLRREVEQ